MKYEIEERAHRHCLECGHEIHYGREDKKFCSSKCRNDYHNKKAHDHRAVQARVSAILNKNYSILRNIIISGQSAADIGQLIQWGFNPEFMTANRKALNRNQCWCYDVRYQMTATKIWNIEYESLPKRR